MDEFDWEEEKYITSPLGIKLVFKDKYIFPTNPFNCVSIDTFIRREISNILTTQNNALLFEFGEIFQNNLYITLCNDVLENTELNQDYMIQLYYPLLYKKNINSLELLKDKKYELEQQQREINNKNFIEYNKTIDILYNIYDKKNTELDYLKSTPGITEITFTIHPIYKIVFPLEILFKIIHSSKEIPMIKFNPGRKNENIYRFFTDNNMSQDGRKIPYLYTSSSNKKNKIFKISRQIATSKKVSYYIEVQEETKKYIFLCNFLQNGNIIISTQFSEPKKIDFIENIVNKYINEPIIKNIKNFLEQSGYTYVDFNNLSDENIEINSISYAFELQINKKIKLTPIIGCLSSIFNVIKVDNKKDEIHMVYKRVGNYNELDSQQSFINNLRKQGIDSNEIINKLSENFKLTIEHATRKYIEWASDVATELGLFANKKLSILTNTGFPIFIRRNKINNITTITVESINNINYIKFIKIYVDTIFRLIIDKNTTDIDNDKINTLCSKKAIDIKKENDIQGNVESKLLERAEAKVEEGGEIVFDNEDDDDFLDLLGMNDEEYDEDEGKVHDDEDEDDIWDDDDDDDDDLFGGELVVGVSEKKERTPSPDKSDDESDDEIESNINIDLEGVPIKGTKSIFMQKKLELEPRLFLKNERGRYKAYSRSCSSSKAKQPIILTTKELKYIDDKDKTFGMKSYDEFLTYGSKYSKNKEKYHYICPRYWCMADDSGKSRSITLKEINEGGCGGWDAVIPQGSSKVPKGGRIYEFTDTRWHKENVDTKNRLVYKPMFPGYQDKDKHPDNLCVPCCFTKPSGLPKGWEKTKGVVNGKKTDLWRKHDEGGKLIETQTKEPTIYMDHMYKPIGNSNKEGKGPNFETDANGNILLDKIDINAKQQKREKHSSKQNKQYSICDQRTESENKNKNKNPEEKIYGAPLDGDESFPINMGQLGYLPQPVVLFLQYEQQNIILSQIGRNLIKNEKGNAPPRYTTGLLARYAKKGPISYLLRKGMEKHETQSFLACIADTYGNIENPQNNNKFNTLKSKPLISIAQLKEQIILNIKLDTFVKLQNGNLVRIFYKERNFGPEIINKYKDSKIISYLIDKNIEDRNIYIYKIIAAFENFIDFIKDNEIVIDYEFLWDFLSMEKSKGGLFNAGLNLFILNSPSDDITQKIEVICPTNHFNNEHFSSNKPTLILYSRNGYYEPIYRYTRNQKDSYKIMKTFNLENIKNDVPEVADVFLRIRNMLIEECKPLPSLPDKYKFRENISFNSVRDLLVKYLPKSKIVKQVINYNTKTIALIIQIKSDFVYLPILPSQIVNNLEFNYVNEPEIIFNYDKSIKLLNTIHNISRKNIPCKPMMKLNDEGIIVGIVTETNQLIPTTPKVSSEGSESKNDLEEIYDTTINKDKEFLLVKNDDNERKTAVKKIKLETNFYNVFRNTLRMIMENLKFKTYRTQLLDICESELYSYIEKINMITQLLKNLLEPFISFETWDIHKNIDITKLTKCMGIKRGKKCNKTSGCTFALSVVEDKKKCKLILPKDNLFSSADNSELYFLRLSDELIRQKLIRNFILKPKTYLSFQKINYELRNDEIILLEDLLYNEYFDNLLPITYNKYINNRNTYDNTMPANSIPYSDKFLSSTLYEDIGSQIDLHCVKETSKQLKLNFWMRGRKVGDNVRRDNGLDNSYKIIEFKKNNNCSWEIFKQILKREGIDYSIDKLRLFLIDIYNQKNREGYSEEIYELLKKEHKTNNYKSFQSGTDIENIITIHNYYLTTIDLFILSQKFNIPIIVLTGVGNIWINKSKKLSWIKDRDYCYIIYSASWNIPNKTPTYGLLVKNDNIQIPIADLKAKKIFNEMTQNNLITLDDFITMSKDIGKKNKKSSMVIQLRSNESKKSHKPKKLKKKILLSSNR